MENKKEKGLLLSWNSANSDWNYKEAYLKVKSGEKSEIEWRTNRKNGVEEKTEVFLVKIGDEEPKGIIAHGYVTEEPYLEDERYYVNIEFDKILDYENEEFLKQEDLVLKFPEQNWSPQASGIEIKKTILPELKKMWDELVKKDN